MKKLKKWQIVLIVILALGVIGALAGGGDEEKKNGEPAAEKTDNKKKEDKKKEPKEKTYGIKDTLKVGDVEYTVNGIETTDTIGDEYLNQKAQETYLIVSVTVKNNGDCLLYTSVPEACDFVLKEAYIKIETILPDATAGILLQGMYYQLSTMQESYADYITINDQEV